MQLKYLFILAAFQLTVTTADAQNTPVLTQTSANGTYTITIPPEVQTANMPNASVVTYAPLVPISDPLSVNESSAPSDVKQQVTYFDGSQQPFQVISRNSANVNGVAKNLVQLYDNRPTQDRYSFLPYASEDGYVDLTAYQDQYSYYANAYPNEGYTSFSKTVNSSSASELSMTSFAPGKGMVGNQFGSKTKSITNGASSIIIWDLDASGLPYANGYYAANQLMGTETTNPDASGSNSSVSAARTDVYSDRDGKTVLKLVAESSTTSPATITYTYTYYVYDEKGNLRYTITPKAYQYYLSQGSLTTAILNNLCFQYQYDAKGRMCAVRKPGEGDFTYIVYDRKNRPVMRQTPNERASHEWEVTFMDGLGRTKVSSVYTDAAGIDHNAWQNNIDTWTSGGSYADLLGYLTNPALEAAYPVGSNPVNDLTNNAYTLIVHNSVMTINYYDDYAQLDPNKTLFAECQNTVSLTPLTSSGAELPQQSLRSYGMPTGSIVRILRSPGAASSVKVGDWRTSVVFYDDKGRTINSKSFVTDNVNGHTIINTDYTGMQYDFAGRVLMSGHVLTNTNSIDNGIGATHTEITKNQYDALSGALVKTVHSVDGNPWTTLSSYLYDDLGRVKRKTLGTGGEVQDMDYNIRGQLTGINGTYAETANKGGYSKTFGESLKYDYGFTQPRYDGRIAGMVWRGSSTLDMYAYGYDYTQNGALKRADFNHQEGGNWAHTTLDYSVSNLLYDKNGNMTSMKQRGQKPGTGPVDMDILSYTYGSGDISNQLSQVSDAGVADYGAGDFHGTAANTYDLNGNLYSDIGLKNIATTTYTRFNKPVVVTFENGSTVEYSYDAMGNKVEELVTDAVHAKRKRTDYLGNAVYQNTYNTSAGNGTNSDSLQYILTGDGRTTFNFTTAVPTEEYFVKDHLGNVRSVINVSSYELHTYLATYELASAHLEDLVFDNMDDIRDIRPGGNDDNTMAANLNGGDASRTIGTSLLVHVMAGDKVAMNVSSYFNGYIPEIDQPLGANAVMSQIVSTLMGGDGGFSGSESHNTRVVQQVFNPDNYQVLDGLTQSITDPNKPKAYLNYALFDENMNLVKEMSGAFQASGDGDWAEIGTTSALEVPTNGYLAVYLSNTSNISQCIPCADVYFDQMIVNITHGNLLEENHYYPHGLPIFGLTSQVSNADYRINRKKYQGNEYITDLSLNWMSFGARQYDPQIGRFLGVDPLADQGGQDSYSPYAAMGNQPESAVDPNGLQGPQRDLSTPNFENVRNNVSADGSGAGLATDLNWLMTGNNDGSDGSHPNFSANFSSMGINGVAINLFWNTFSASLKSMILADYNSYEVRQDSKRADNQHTYEMGELLYSLAGWKGGITGNMKKGFIFSPLEIKEGSYKWDNSGGNSGDNESNWYGAGGQGNWLFGATATAVEKLSGIARFGSNLKFYGATARGGVFLGNQYVKTFSIAKLGNTLGYVSAGIGTIMDAKGVYNFLYNTDPNSVKVSPAKFSANLGMSATGLWINPPAAMMYFGMDAFYPGGWPGYFRDIGGVQQELNKGTNYQFRLIPFGSK